MQPETDSNGRFRQTKKFNAPGFLRFKVELSLTLKSPDDTIVTGKLNLDRGGGLPTYQERVFRASTGQRVSLGRWEMDGGVNVFVISGHTDPQKPNTKLTIDLDAQL